MIIHGKERYFKLTVGASAEIAELCPQGDLSRMAELFNQPYGKEVRSVAKIISALSRGYENAKKFDDADHVVDALSTEEILCLDTVEYQAVVEEALKAFNKDTATTVKAEASKKKLTGETLT